MYIICADEEMYRYISYVGMCMHSQGLPFSRRQVVQATYHGNNCQLKGYIAGIDESICRAGY